MNSKQIFACMICYTTYDTKQEAINCAVDECGMVKFKFQCSECEDLWDTEERANWCCSEEDTLEERASFDGARFESDYEAAPLDEDEEE